MCTSPIRIKNRTKTCKDGITREYLMVPCGKCEECRTSNADAWFQRIHAEFMDCSASAGKVIFVTFTYNDLNLPRFHYTDIEGNERSFPCFCKKHKDRYVNSLKKYFERLGCPTNLKYMWASEYGMDTRFTHRPHYHVLFFVPKSWLDKVGYDEGTWKRLLTKYWNYGFTRFSPDSSIFVNSEFAGMYTSKYICKDIHFYAQPDVEEYMQDVKVSKTDKKYLAVRDYLPRHWQTIYFGASLESIYSNKDAYINGYDFGLLSEKKKGKVIRHRCPAYIEKRMLYRTNDIGQQVLNSRGKEFKRDKFLSRVYHDFQKYLQYCTASDIEKKIQQSDIHINSVLSGYENSQKLADFISSVLTQHNRHSVFNGAFSLYLYNRVWSGQWSVDDNDLETLESVDFDTFVSESIQQYISSIYNDNFDRYSEDGIFNDFSPSREGFYFYDFCHIFQDFDRLLKVIGEIESIYRNRVHQRYLEDRAIRKKCKFLVA